MFKHVDEFLFSLICISFNTIYMLKQYYFYRQD